MNSEQDEPFKKLAEVVKIKVSAMEEREGIKPTFEDYIEEMIEEGVISVDNLEMHMRAHALAWSGARLGKSNWKELYNVMVVEISNADDNLNKDEIILTKGQDESTVKANKNLGLFTSLGLEVDEEIIKAIKNVGIIKLILGGVVFFLLRFLVSYFGSEDDVFKFYFYLGIGLLFFLSWYMSGLKGNSKIYLTLKYGAFILGTVVSIVLVLGLLYGIVEVIIDAFY